MTPVFFDPTTGGEVWRNSEARPIAYFSGAARIQPNAQRAQMTFLSSQDMRGITYVDHLPSACDASLHRPFPAPQDINDVLLSPNQFRVTFRARAPGLVVVVESYARGWRALLNNRATDVLTANGTFLAVCVPHAGAYTLALTYRPPLWNISIEMAGGGTLAALAPGVLALRRRPRSGLAGAGGVGGYSPGQRG